MSVHMIPYHRSPPSSDNPRAGLWVRRVYVDLTPRAGLVRGLWPLHRNHVRTFPLDRQMKSQPASLCFAVRLTEEWRSRDSFLRKNRFASTSGEFTVHGFHVSPSPHTRACLTPETVKNSSESDVTDSVRAMCCPSPSHVTTGAKRQSAAQPGFGQCQWRSPGYSPRFTPPSCRVVVRQPRTRALTKRIAPTLSILNNRP